jgi:hypothetical protein
MPVMRITDEETIARFTLRARRIEAHSLVQNRETFAGFLQEKLTMRMSVDGIATARRALPADEEVFESLAARARPLVLPTEPIHYRKVLEALRRLMSAVEPTTKHTERLDQLSAAWAAIALGRQVQSYAVRAEDLDGTNLTELVSDNELAAGWMYADLVHADPQGWKEQALKFSLRERYAAAVTVFCRIAALTVTTLRFIEQLHHDGVVVLDEQVWDEDVVVGASEIVYENVTAYFADPDTEIPETLSAPGEPWTQLTATEHLRIQQARHVDVELLHSGAVVAIHDAVMVHRGREDDIAQWHVLVANSIVVRVQARGGEDNWVPFSIDLALAGTTHRTQLAANSFLLQMHQAQSVRLRWREGVVEFEPDALQPETLLELQTTVELLEDLVSVEKHSGQTIGTPARQLTTPERVRCQSPGIVETVLCHFGPDLRR